RVGVEDPHDVEGGVGDVELGAGASQSGGHLADVLWVAGARPAHRGVDDALRRICGARPRPGEERGGQAHGQGRRQMSEAARPDYGHRSAAGLMGNVGRVWWSPPPFDDATARYAVPG